MKTLSWKKMAVIIIPALMLGVSLLLYACGSGGGSGGGSDRNDGAGSSAAGAGTLYITDAPIDTYQQVILTVYSVEFEKPDGTRVVIFSDAAGITYDVSKLVGILSKLPNASIPAGVYSKVFTTIGSEVVLVDSLGAPVAPNPIVAANAWTTCIADKCTIEIAQSVTVVNNQSVVLDFDLKSFDYDPAANTVTAKLALQESCSASQRYFEEKEDDFELKGTIQTKAAGGFDITVTKAEHFMPDSNMVTVTVSGNTLFTCDGDDSLISCGISAYDDLQAGMTVEIHGQWDGQKMVANEVAVDNDNDIKSSGAASCSSGCTGPDRSATGYTGLTVQKEIKANTFSFDPSGYAISVSGKTLLITKETVIELDAGDEESYICPDKIPSSAREMEAEYSQGLDSENNQVFIARKISFEL